MRCTKTLEISFNKTLHRLIGLKSRKVVGGSILGIGTIRVSAKDSGIVPVAKELATSCQTSVPTVFQYVLKKIGWNPSGPGAL